MAGEHPCAVEGCGRQVATDMLMCLPHWKALPGDIKSEVWKTWRNVRRDRASYEEARERAVQWHRNHSSNPNTQGSLL